MTELKNKEVRNQDYEEMIAEVKKSELPPQIVASAISLILIAQQTGKNLSLDEIIQEAYLIEKFTRSRFSGEREVIPAQEVGELLHDIRNLTMAASGMINIVMQGIREGTHEGNPVLKGDLTIAHNALTKLTDLVEASRELTNGEQLRLEKTNITELMQTSVDLIKRSFLKQRSMEKVVKIEVDCPDDLIAFVDPVDITRAIENILRNGIEAMYPNGGLITVKVFPSVKDGKIVISISDTGKGIPQEEIRHICTPGYTRKKRPGHGLGMTNVYKTLSRNNGEVEVISNTKEDNPDRTSGTNITVKLPRFAPTEKLNENTLKRVCLVQVGGQNLRNEMKEHVTSYLHLRTFPQILVGLKHIPQESIVIIHDDEIEEQAFDESFDPIKFAHSLSKDRPDLSLVFAKKQEGITPNRKDPFNGILNTDHGIDDLTNMIVQIRTQIPLTEAIESV